MFNLKSDPMKANFLFVLLLLSGKICFSQTTTPADSSVSGNDTTAGAEETAGIASSFSYKNDFRIYPNPATDHFYVDTRLSDFTLKIYNMKGDVVLKKENLSEVRTEDMQPGIYFVTISDREGRQLIKKLVIQ
jgi:hypothetical protein